MAPQFAEIGRIAAVAGASIDAALSPGFCSLNVENALTAPVYIKWSAGGPAGPGSYDAVVAGSSVRTVPIPPYATNVYAQVKYVGSVPASDSGLACIISATSANLGSTSGPLV